MICRYMIFIQLVVRRGDRKHNSLDKNHIPSQIMRDPIYDKLLNCHFILQATINATEPFEFTFYILLILNAEVNNM